MRLSTSTNLFSLRFGEKTFLPFPDILRLCHDAGFRVMDANFCAATGKPESGHPLTAENWQAQIEGIRNTAEALGMSFSQSHLPFERGFYKRGNTVTDEEKAHFDSRIRRAIDASAMLGVQWAVVHPWTNDLTVEHSREINLATNYEFYAPLVDYAKRQGVGIAMENMMQAQETFVYRFAAQTEELIACIDQFGDPSVGACWDFGHGNLIYKDQTHPLRALGKRLKALHVDDNAGKGDDHLLPFVGGTVDWKAMMAVLREIGYEGDFTYEIQRFSQKLPACVRPTAAKLAYEVGQYLLSL